MRGLLPAFDGGRLGVAAVRDLLSDVSTRAESAAVGLTVAADHSAVVLLAQTARALHMLLGEERSTGAVLPDAPLAAGGRRAPEQLPAALIRVARMEHWLTTRAHEDAIAEPAADLCLWVLDHLEP